MNNDNPYDSAAGENKTSIFVVIVNNTLRNLVCEFITRFSHLTVCGVACSVEEALVTIGQAPLQPEVALIDVFAPEKDIPGIYLLKERYPSLHILAVSGYYKRETALNTLAAGADVYLMKEELNELEQAVNEIMKGKHYISQKVQSLLGDGQSIAKRSA